MLRRMRTFIPLFRRRSHRSPTHALHRLSRSSIAGQRGPVTPLAACAGLLCAALGLLLSSCQPAELEDEATASAGLTAALQRTDSDRDPRVTTDAEDSALQSTDPTDAPPAGCWAERSCGARKYVCKRPDTPRPCGAPGCSEMQFTCSSDAGCLEGYRCVLCKPGDPFPCTFATGMCRPATCATDRDCGSPNLVCQSGACAHKTCRTSRSCRGYCVAGSCWNKAGWCHDTTLPPPP